MLQLGPEHDQVEGGDGVDFAGLRVDGVQVSWGKEQEEGAGWSQSRRSRKKKESSKKKQGQVGNSRKTYKGAGRSGK